jgi:hypothetical protein
MSKNPLILNLSNENEEIITRSKDIIQMRNLSTKFQLESPITSGDHVLVAASSTNNINNSNNSIIVDESVLTDDIASMSLLDDRTIAASLKAKYENKIVYVS